jgi:hypothetical protein
MSKNNPLSPKAISSTMMQWLNAGELKLDDARTPLIATWLSISDAAGESNAAVNRPKLLLCSQSSELYPFMRELLVGGVTGIVRYPMGETRCLAALAFESQTKAVWCLFDPHGPAGRQMLLDWQMHQDVSMTCVSPARVHSANYQIKTNLISKLLATPESQRERLSFDEQLCGMWDIERQFQNDSKERLFVLLASETPLDVRDIVPAGQ